jgi:hypothetical protein
MRPLVRQDASRRLKSNCQVFSYRHVSHIKRQTPRALEELKNENAILIQSCTNECIQGGNAASDIATESFGTIWISAKV